MVYMDTVGTCICACMHTYALYIFWNFKLSLKGYKITIPKWNAEHGVSNERRHSTGSFETGFKTTDGILLELEP